MPCGCDKRQQYLKAAARDLGQGRFRAAAHGMVATTRSFREDAPKLARVAVSNIKFMSRPFSGSSRPRG